MIDYNIIIKNSRLVNMQWIQVVENLGVTILQNIILFSFFKLPLVIDSYKQMNHNRKIEKINVFN